MRNNGIGNLRSIWSIALFLVCVFGCTGSSVDSTPLSVCGNGLIENLELCDDGNLETNDGCSPQCRLEAGYVCDADAAPCLPCLRQCEQLECGSDGCGGSCGVCAEYEACMPNGLCAELADSPADDPTEATDPMDPGDVSEPSADTSDDSESSPEESFCSFECRPSEVGDGMCQPACYVATCGYDQNATGQSDCTCDELDLLEDCSGYCFQPSYASLASDNFCDDGTESPLNFMCPAWRNDGGACSPDFINPEAPPPPSTEGRPRCPDDETKLVDCVGYCFELTECDGLCTSWVGDGYCDNGEYGLDFQCDAWDNDAGDCD